MTKGKTYDINIAKKIAFPSGSIAVFDCGYIDFEWLHKLTMNDVFFVTQAKDNINFRIQSRNKINPDDRYWLKKYWLVTLEDLYSSADYPQILRLVKIVDMFWIKARINFAYK